MKQLMLRVGYEWKEIWMPTGVSAPASVSGTLCTAMNPLYLLVCLLWYVVLQD